MINTRQDSSRMENASHPMVEKMKNITLCIDTMSKEDLVESLLKLVLVLCLLLLHL